MKRSSSDYSSGTNSSSISNSSSILNTTTRTSHDNIPAAAKGIMEITMMR